MSDIVDDAKAEITGMAKQGMRHPSTKPVLIAGAVGGVAGALLPLLSVPVGLLMGAGYMFYKRLRP
jgi:hypothetical protein